MEDDYREPCPSDYEDGEPINPNGEDVSAHWPDWLKVGAREVDILCNHNKESDNG